MKCKQCGGDLSIAPDGSVHEFDFIALSHDEVRVVPVADGGLFRVTKDAGVFCCPACIVEYYARQGKANCVSNSEHQALKDASRHHVECLTSEIKALIAIANRAVPKAIGEERDRIIELIKEARAKGGV